MFIFCLIKEKEKRKKRKNKEKWTRCKKEKIKERT